MKFNSVIIAMLSLSTSIWLYPQNAWGDDPESNDDDLSTNTKAEDDVEVDDEPDDETNLDTTVLTDEAMAENGDSVPLPKTEQDTSVLTEEAMAENEVLTDDNLALTTEEAMAEYERAQFFLKAFGKEMPETFYDHDVQIILDQTAAMHGEVKINPYTQGVQFYSATLVPFLEDNLLNTPLAERLGNNLPEMVSEDFLREQGFHIEVDMKRLTVMLNSPLDLRKKINVFLRPQSRIVTFQPDSAEAKPINGYVNMSHALNHAGAYNAYNGLYNVNVNVQDWVFQSDMQYSSIVEQRGTITGGRVVKDLHTRQVRLTFGDNSSPNTDLFLEKPPLASGFQKALFGVDVSHVGQFDRMRRRSNHFNYLLMIEEMSHVSIEVNGQIIFNEIMVPGKYEVQDFPFQTGKNDIRILCNSENGTTQDIELEYFHNPSLLSKGQSEYQLVSGLPYTETNSLLDIDTSRPTNLAYLRYGLTDQVGTTAYIQTVQSNAVFGSILEYGFGSNITSLELAHSSNAQGQTGNALRLQAYSSNSNYFTEGLSYIPNYYTLNIDYRSQGFDRDLSGVLDISTNNIRGIISPSVIWQLTNFWQLQASGIWTDNREIKDTQSVEIRTYYRTRQWLFDASYEQTMNMRENTRTIFTNATWRPKGAQRNRVNHRYNTASNMHTLSANLWPEQNSNTNYRWQTDYLNTDNVTHDATVRHQTLNNTWTTRLNRSTNDGISNHSLMVDFDGPRALVDVSHIRPPDWYSTTNLSLNMAVAFVGKYWGISRPINESFAILYANNEGLKDGTVRFQNGSILDKYSSAVYPFLGNYQTYEMGIYTADIPIGLDLGAQQYHLQASLNSGQAIPVGKPGGIIMATATFLKSNGQPFDLEVGYFINAKEPELKVQFFTNRTGKLFVQGLKSGTYTVEFVSSKYQSLTLTIPKDAESPLDLGVITISESKQKK